MCYFFHSGIWFAKDEVNCVWNGQLGQATACPISTRVCDEAGARNNGPIG